MRPFVLLRNVLFCALPLTLTACAAAPETAVQPRLDPAYTVAAEMTYGEDSTAALTMTRAGDGKWEMCFSEPQSLAGVTLSLDGSAVSASYKGLAFTVPKQALPAKNLLAMTAELLDSVSGSELPCTAREDGTLCAAGSSTGGSYELTFSGDGTLCGLEIPSQPLCIRFSGYTAEAAAETTAAPPETASSSAETTTTANEGTS